MRITTDGRFFYDNYIDGLFVHGISIAFSGVNFTLPVVATSIDNNLLGDDA